jgi:hypothetical protein
MAQTQRSPRRPIGAKSAARSESRQSPHRDPPVCTVSFCPICTMVTAAGELRPEVAAHVMAAGRELLLAMRALIDARLDGTKPQPVRLERLTIE